MITLTPDNRLLSDNLADLHAFARRMKLSPAKFRTARTTGDPGTASPPHYQINAYQRTLAIILGAVRSQQVAPKP